ncbi:dihydrofolate reductase [Arthrobacter castelli]|uniref:dihydrofolate reductase n=1 Tax=Arthrobacter castelli TaxID=271431 RepID=UPI000479D604|nr:dihydrofolate reductase [Arthrobacter castelli]
MSPEATPAGGRVVGMIWAQTPDGIIGRDGTMPWDVPEDMAHFKATTAGHPVIMGRRTWESFPPQFRPLPGRTNIVISRQADQQRQLTDAGATAVDSVGAALAAAAGSPGSEEIWILGGGQVYEAAIANTSRAAVTIIDVDEDGDTRAPVLDDSWTLSSTDPAEGWHQSRKGARYRIEVWNR